MLEKLATGGMAEVFLARAPGADGIGKFFAIKRILPQFAESPEFIDMFKDEAKIAINLNHSNIVSIHEFGVQNNQFYIVMDFVEGKNLRQILNKLKKVNQKFTVDQIVYICKEVAGGLDHAHRCLDGTTGKPLNITHRDMSPQNIMTSFEGEVKIVDFGIAKAESQMETTRAGTLKGKFGYMSPEQAEGQTVDLRTDIFSMGIVLWELLANDRLFIANNEINTLRKIRDCQIPSLRKINPNIHAELERIVMKALTKDRNLRYQTSAAMQRDLSRFLNRQYPDFSPHDFSVNIKTLFAEEILANRKRFIEFSKVPFRNEQAQFANTQSHRAIQTGTEPSLSMEGTAAQTRQTETLHQQNDEMASSTHTQDGPSNGVGLATDNSLPGPLAPPTPNYQGTPAAAPNTLQFPEEMGVQQGAPTRSRPIHPTQTESPLAYERDKEDEGTSQQVLQGVVIFLFVVVTYSYLAKYQTAAMRPILRITNPILSPLHSALGIQGEEKLSSQAEVLAPRPPPVIAPPLPVGGAPALAPAPARGTVAPSTSVASLFDQDLATSVVVKSNPSGAEIFINSKSTGQSTPARVELPTDRYFELSLKKPGYMDVPNQKLDRMGLGSQFSVTLQQAQVGYLDLDVSPPRDVEITVNGERLSFTQLPVFRIPVPADKRVLVRAEDSRTHRYVETTVYLPLDKHKQILLDFRNSKPPRK